MMDDDKNEEVANVVDDLAITDKVDRSTTPIGSDDNKLDENEQLLHSASINCSNNSVQPQPANLTFTKTPNLTFTKTEEIEDTVREMNAVASNQLNLTCTYKTDNSADLSPVASDTTYNVPTLQDTNIPQLQIPSTKSITNEVS